MTFSFELRHSCLSLSPKSKQNKLIVSSKKTPQKVTKKNNNYGAKIKKKTHRIRYLKFGKKYICRSIRQVKKKKIQTAEEKHAQKYKQMLNLKYIHMVDDTKQNTDKLEI